MDDDGATTTRERISTDDAGDFPLTTPYRGDGQLTITDITRLQQRPGSTAVVYGDEDTVRPSTA